MARQMPYNNFHDMNMDWIIKQVKTAYTKDNPPPYPVKSVNGQTGVVQLTGGNIPFSEDLPQATVLDFCDYALDALDTLANDVSSKQDAPVVLGNPGQVLGLDSDQSPVWVNQPDPESIIDDNAGLGDTTKVYSANYLSGVLGTMVDDIQELQDNLYFINTVQENTSISNTILTAPSYKTYYGKSYTIDTPITLNNADNVYDKIIAGATFTLNSTMFTWTNPWMPLPDFIDCIFIGNGNYIIDNNLYCSKSKFVNCIFYDCGIINNGDELQSAKFINCRFAGTTKLISAKIVNEFIMDSCQLESNFNAGIVDTSSYDKNGFTSVQSFRILNTIIEGQSASTDVLFKISQGGQIFFDKCYFEQVMCGLLDIVTPTNPPTNPMMMLSVRNCKFSVGRRPFINIASYFENENRVYIDISNNQLNDSQNNSFINTINFKNILIQNNIIGSNYITLVNQSSLTDIQNDIADLKNRNNIKVVDFWVDGTMASSDDTTINSYGPQIGAIFDKFAYPDRLKYTNTISMAIIEKTQDSNNANPVNGVWIRPRLYGNNGYANYIEVLQTSNNAVVTTGKYRIRIAYTD